MSDSPRSPPPLTVEAALAAVADTSDLPTRLERLSALFLGRPYVSFPLIGGPDVPEELVTRLDGFDCVTFAETVLALGRSRTAADFPAALAALRYLEVGIRWADRNHYMTEWIRRNVRAGHVARVLPRRWVWADPPRVLSVLPRYHQVPWRPRYLPSSAEPLLAAHAQAGDLVGFVSNRADLDTFHVGLLVPGKTLAVRHASRSAGGVVHQELAEFLAKNDVPGVLALRLNPHIPGESP